MTNIHPLATVHPGAQLGENVEVGPYAYIDDNVIIGDNCKNFSTRNSQIGRVINHSRDGRPAPNTDKSDESKTKAEREKTND